MLYQAVILAIRKSAGEADEVEVLRLKLPTFLLVLYLTQLTSNLAGTHVECDVFIHLVNSHRPHTVYSLCRTLIELE